jgi:hypothetical protein
MIAQTIQVQVGSDTTLNWITLGLAAVTLVMALGTIYLGWQTRESVDIARRALLHEHIAQVKQWVYDQQVLMATRRAAGQLDGHIDMTQPMAEIFAEHFGSVAGLVGKWNDAVKYYVTTWHRLKNKSDADTSALGYMPTNRWPLFWSAQRYAAGDPAAVDALDLQWSSQDTLFDRAQMQSVILDHPVNDAEKVGLAERLRERCLETARWDETIAYTAACDHLADIEKRLDRAFKKVQAGPELPGTCSSEGGPARRWRLPWRRPDHHAP